MLFVIPEAWTQVQEKGVYQNTDQAIKANTGSHSLVSGETDKGQAMYKQH